MKNWTLLILLLLFGINSITAQQYLSIEQCRELALQNNKSIKVAQQQTIVADYTRKSYKGNFFPNIYATATGLYSNAKGGLAIAGGNLPTLSPDGNFDGGSAYFPGLNLDYKVETVFMGGITLEQPIYMGGRVNSAYRMAVLGKEMSILNKSMTEVDVIVKTDEAYVNVVKAVEMNKVATLYNKLLQELYKNVESAYRHGLKPRNDMLKVQVRLNESELDIRRTENAHRLAMMNLCHYVGLPLTENIVVSDSFPVMDEVTATVFDVYSRPEYKILEKQVSLSKEQVKLSRSEVLPNVGLSAGWNYVNGLSVNENDPLFDSGSFYVALNVSIPIFHFGERYNKVRASKAKLIRQELEREDLNEKMLLELTQAINNWDEMNMECEIADKSLLQAEENMNISKSQYDVGLETLSDYLEAQLLWQQAYETKIDAHFRRYLSYIIYLKTSGQLN